MSVAWLYHLQYPSLFLLWFLPTLLLSGPRGRGTHPLFTWRPSLLLQSQPCQSPGLQLQLYPATLLHLEPHQSERGARGRDTDGPDGCRMTPQHSSIPHSLWSALLLASRPPLVRSRVLWKGIQCFMISVVAPTQRGDTLTNTSVPFVARPACWQATCLSTIGAVPRILFFFAMKHYLYSSAVPVWWNHRLILLFSFVIFQSRQCCHPHIPALWRNSKVRSRKRRQVEEARSKLSTSSTTEPLHSLFTCCKMSLAHRRALSPPLQPVFTPNIMVSQHPFTQFLLLGEGEGRMTEFVQFLFPLGPHYIPTFLHMFLIYLWV